jgi:hypothetical protein
MADTREHQGQDLDAIIRAATAALEAALEQKKKADEEAEEKRKAEEAEAKRKADEAEAKRKAEEAEEAKKVAEEAAEKKKAEAERAEADRREKARTSQAAYEQGIRVVLADQKKSAEQTARINAQALATKKRKLADLGVGPNDPLMQVPVGPGPSNAEVRNIRKSLVHQPRKRKVVDDDESVVLADATEYAAGVAVSVYLISISARLT